MEMIIFSHRRSSRYTSHWPSGFCVVYLQISSDPQMHTTLRCEQQRPARAQTILLQTLLITDVQSPGSQVESRYAPGPFTRCVEYNYEGRRSQQGGRAYRTIYRRAMDVASNSCRVCDGLMYGMYVLRWWWGVYGG